MAISGCPIANALWSHVVKIMKEKKKRYTKYSKQGIKKSYKDREPITTYLRVKTLGMLINVYKAQEKVFPESKILKSVCVHVCER